MIVRNIIRGSAGSSLQALRPTIRSFKHRSYSSSTTCMPSSSTPSSASMLGTFTNELDKIAPRFEVEGSQINVLRSPSEFYKTLKTKILNAERQIFLSTLYIGKTEHGLMSTLQQALRAKPELKLSILTDALRGTREAPNPTTAFLLAPLVSEFGSERVDVRMYHTPNLTGLRKKYIPERINEGWGLQHMKLYGVDDEIIISGANLSNDYFTDRQDRYHVFSSKEITEYFFRIHSAVSSLSFQVVPDAQLPAGFVLDWPSTNSAVSPLADPKKYIAASTSILNQLIKAQPQSVSFGSSQRNTTVYPVSQLSPLLNPDSSTELPAITTILQTLALPTFKSSSWIFTAGYFNPDPSLTSLLLSTASTSNTVITASPQANGFYGSKGVSGLLPAAYTLLSRRFLETAARAKRQDEITLKEWKKGTVNQPDGWTYHAKGLWVSLNGEKEPSISVVGSSNYTKRSYSLDLEVGTVIVTSDEGLKKRLREERDDLQNYAQEIRMDDFLKVERRVGLQVRIAMWIVEMVGGAL
ncbi:CDP-diacylglycerol-glycerol-3-phosphate 3-phosphatidyltransferas-like protein, partial [Calycina marina]